MTKGASNLPPLSLLETGTSLQKAVTVSGKRSAAAAEVGCPKCTGSIKMSLAKTTPCAFPSEMFLCGLTARLRHREWLWRSECYCRALGVLSSIHWGTEDLCLTKNCDSVLLWDCPNTVYRASFFFMNMKKPHYSLPKTLHRYSDVFNHDFLHTTQNKKHIFSIALTSEFVSNAVFSPHYCLIWYLWPFHFAIFWRQQRINNDTNISK